MGDEAAGACDLLAFLQVNHLTTILFEKHIEIMSVCVFVCLCGRFWSFVLFVYLPKVNMSMPERVCVSEFRFGVIWVETSSTISEDAAGTDCSNLHLLLEADICKRA